MGSLCACCPAGLAFYRIACRPVSLSWCGSKEARAHSTRIRSAHPGFTTERRASAVTTTIGIDPHKGSHTAVAIDNNEHVLDEIRVRSCSTRTVRLREWADRFEERTWAVESAHGLGYLLAQQLVAAGENVIDVPPVRASRVRVLGSGRSQKNDPNGARSIAIAALRADDLSVVCVDDHARVLKLLSKRHRDLGRLKNKACCRLHALLLEMVPGGAGFKIAAVTRVNAVIDSYEPVDAMGRQRQEIAYELAADIGRYNELLDASKHRIQTALTASATSLTTIGGVGPITAAVIIGQSGNIDRLKSKHHFASYNATAPVEASSGPKVRHRLNQRGNRQLNWAIHIIAISQLRHDTAGRVYYDRKVAEGKTSKEAIRALKRQLSDVVYRHLVADARHQH